MNSTQEQHSPDSWKSQTKGVVAAAANTISSFWPSNRLKSHSPPVNTSVWGDQATSLTHAPKKDDDIQQSRPREAHVERLSLMGFDFQLSTITRENLESFRSLNLSLFPVVYHERFYRDVLLKYPVLFSRIAYSNGTPIGAISCRKEVVGGHTQAYIMTIGVLDPYRRVGLGSLLLSKILRACDQDQTIQHTCLHVHVSNNSALQFYARNGFRIDSRVDGYYEKNIGVDPPDAFFLKRSPGGSKLYCA